MRLDSLHEPRIALNDTRKCIDHIHDKETFDLSKDLGTKFEQRAVKKSQDKTRRRRRKSDSEKLIDRSVDKHNDDVRVDLAQNPQCDNYADGAELKLKSDKNLKSLKKIEELPLPALEDLTPLQAKMRDKLTSARFRYLNETLYTSPSSISLDLFTASPDLFAEYHAGFAQQVKDSWPENPVDGYINAIKARAQGYLKQDSATDLSSLPRRKTGSCTVADLGCGDAPLARVLQSYAKALNLKFHNFDLHAPNPHVTKADIANLPLRDGEADIAVFCLSLMGTNWLNFVEEAWRVLRGDGKGELWIAEVKSRFGRVSRGTVVEHSVGQKRKPRTSQTKQRTNAMVAEVDVEVFVEDSGNLAQDETDVSAFVNVIKRRGFALQADSVDKHNKMFVSMIFKKSGIPSLGKYKGWKWNGLEYETPGTSTSGRKKFIDDNNEDDQVVSPEEEAKVLKPCVYKKR